MGEILLFASGKGGTGKSVLSANVGKYLAMRHKSVALVDASFGMRDLDLVMGMENRAITHLLDVADEQCELTEALLFDSRFPKEAKGELALLPAPPLTQAMPEHRDKLEKICRQLSEQFDYVILDAPSGMGCGFENAVAFAQKTILVVRPNQNSLRAADQVRSRLLTLKKPAPLLLINGYDPAKERDGVQISVSEIVDITGCMLLGVLPYFDACVREYARPEGENAGEFSEKLEQIASRLIDPGLPYEDPSVYSLDHFHEENQKKTLLERLFGR